MAGCLMKVAEVADNVKRLQEEKDDGTAWLYDPDKMPDSLRTAHRNLDLAVDRLYRSKPFTSDEERLEHLFKDDRQGEVGVENIL